MNDSCDTEQILKTSVRQKLELKISFSNIDIGCYVYILYKYIWISIYIKWFIFNMFAERA